MSICELDMVFDTEQSSWVCTKCGNFIDGRGTVTQDAVDWSMEMLCQLCASDIGPQKRAGARTANNNRSDEIALYQDALECLKGFHPVSFCNAVIKKLDAVIAQHRAVR